LRGLILAAFIATASTATSGENGDHSQGHGGQRAAQTLNHDRSPSARFVSMETTSRAQLLNVIILLLF
jgi:hypothetical protein